MKRAERFEGILDYFQKNVPVAESELDFRSPYELIVAVILSAQCTDRRVNTVTPELFRKWPSVIDLATAWPEDIFPLIKSVSYPNNKAKHLSGMARKVVADFNGDIPSSVEDLMTLPGVGRKTANVVASIIFNEPVIAVDTHVFRVSRRLGLSSGRTPRAVELDLERNIPEGLRPIAHHWLILHGRYTCKAIKPQCERCGLQKWCKFHSSRTAASTPGS